MDNGKVTVEAGYLQKNQLDINGHGNMEAKYYSEGKECKNDVWPIGNKLVKNQVFRNQSYIGQIMWDNLMSYEN